jgi:hypothetical protein
MPHATFQVGDLTAVIGDNGAHGDHRAGYNGVWSLEHKSAARSLFVPAYAGLNHEHIFNGEADAPTEVFFEPRHAPMTFRQLSDHEAELHQPPTPTFQLESWTRFTLVAPHYLDMSYRCIARQHTFPRGYIGLFWASYINAPDDKSMYFRSGTEGRDALWSQLCTQRHDDESTVRHADDQIQLTFRDGHRDTLYRNLSPFRYGLPFYYGLFDELLWMVMFERADGIRFTHSPSGGGTNNQRETTNPAWDFQFLIPNYEVGKEYTFRLRALLRPRCTRQQVLQEYHQWQGA